MELLFLCLIKNDDIMWKKDLRTILLLLFMMLIFGVVYSLVSCTKTQESLVTHDTVFVAHSLTDSASTHHGASDSLVKAHSDTLYVVKSDSVARASASVDSVYVRDSVYIREKGDSVYVYKEKWRERLVFMRDTLYKASTDTVLKIVRDTVYKAVHDTVRSVRYVERSDSAYHSVDANKKVVKERRTLSWLKVLGVMVIVFGVITAWRRFRR